MSIKSFCKEDYYKLENWTAYGSPANQQLLISVPDDSTVIIVTMYSAELSIDMHCHKLNYSQTTILSSCKTRPKKIVINKWEITDEIEIEIIDNYISPVATEIRTFGTITAHQCLEYAKLRIAVYLLGIDND